MSDTFGKVTIAVPRARIEREDSTTIEWKSKTLPASSHRRQLSFGDQHAPRLHALVSMFRPPGGVSNDRVSRVWRKISTDLKAWNKRDLHSVDIVCLILDGRVVRVRLDRKSWPISLLVVLGVRRDSEKVLLAVRKIGGESEAAWRALLDDLVARV